MNETSRERRLEFIADFGNRSLEVGVKEMLAMYGPDWLTDEQILDITRDKIVGWRRGVRQAIRNREIQKARIMDMHDKTIAMVKSVVGID
jgi:hypothetical protein